MNEGMWDWQAAVGIIFGVFILLALMVTCTGVKKETFHDRCNTFCEGSESHPVFCNEEKKQVVCE